MSNELKKTLDKAVVWAEGVKRNESSFTAGSNAAADIVIEYSTQLKHSATDNSTHAYAGDCKIYTGTEWIRSFIGTNLDYALAIKVRDERISKLEAALKVYADESMWIAYNAGKITKLQYSVDDSNSITWGTHNWRGLVDEKHPNETAKEALEGK